MLYQSNSNSTPRPGVVLLVVMALLALFASVGLSFVFYADAEAVAANMSAQSLVNEEPEVDPEVLAAYFLSQFLYPTDNPYSSLRGWDLARSMYGYNPNTLNFTPYNGVGRSALSYPVTFPTGPVDNRFVTNYTQFDAAAGDPLLGMLRKPEFYGKTGDPNFRFVGGANAPWTAYDTNNLYLAQVQADGTVLMPSFYRPWIANNTPANSVAARYMSMSPESSWHPVFANSLVDSDPDGIAHVRNLDVSPGRRMANGQRANNDSRWMDIGFPIMTAPNGKRYKALVAPLVMDLSNRLHLWAHGNRNGPNATYRHTSNGGFGPTEVNLGMGLTLGASPPPAAKMQELSSLFDLKYGGPNGTPASVPVGVVPNLKQGTWYSQIDADSLDPAAGLSSKPLYMGFQAPATNAVQVPKIVPPGGVNRSVTVTPTGTTTNGFPWAFFEAVRVGTRVAVGNELVTVLTVTPASNSFTAMFTQNHAAGTPVSWNTQYGFPIYPAGWNNANAAELLNHPLALNPFRPNLPNLAPLPMSNQEALLRYGGTGGPALPSEIFRRMPATFNDVRVRNMVTLANGHLDRVTGAPFLNFDRTNPGHYTYNPATKYPTLVAAANPPPNSAVPGSVVTSDGTTTPPWKSEFSREPGAGSPGWRSNLGHFLRIDLTRPLADYPAANALPERQQFAKDIYNALVRVTGAQDPNVVAGMTPASADYKAARWLAQLAVNMVDYIDNDNFFTPFNWYPAAAANEGWVFGTELPGLVLNEVYAQHETTPNNRINVWAELLNPLATGDAVLQVGNTPQYEIEVHAHSQELLNWLRDPANNQGTGFPVIAPAAATVPPLATLSNWVPTLPPPLTVPAQTTAITTKVLPVNNAATGTPNIVTRPIVPFNMKAPAMSGAKDAAGTVTITTTTPHLLTAADVGKAVTITGVTNNVGPVSGYDGTFVITAVPSNTTLEYKVAAAAALANAGGGNAIFVKADPATSPTLKDGNAGFYVVGPADARYPNTPAGAARVPNLPVTLATPSLSIPIPSAGVAAISPDPMMTGASHVGNTVTIRTTGALPPTFVVGEKIVVANVVTLNAKGVPVATAHNNSFGKNPPFWTITAVTPNSFSYTVPAATAKSLPATDSGRGTATLYVPTITILLRRLANPNLPFNATTNPFITVDFFPEIPVNDGRAGTRGRRQPYQATQTVGAGTHTFYRHNVQGGAPFTWLVHLDRAPVSPIELMHVSGYKAHELTQQFFAGTPIRPFQHYAPWTDPAALIYRVLDQFSTPYMAGTFTGGRLPGNINLNTIMEREIFQALCDAHESPAAQVPPQYPAPWFTDNQVSLLSGRRDVQTIFANMMTSRGVSNTSAPGAEPASPFKSFTAGNINDTFARRDPTNPAQPLFAVGAANSHPYVRNSLLQKIHNNVSTTSNVFAVWWTVGYFEVVDESVKPARLGAEIGRDQNRHVRHRFFAVVDRSGMELFNTRSSNNATGAVTITPGVALPQTKSMNISAASLSSVGGMTAAWNATQRYVPGNTVRQGATAFFCIQDTNNTSPSPPTTNTAYWQRALQPGMLLEIGAIGANSQPEVVVVKTVNAAGNGFTADFMWPHASGATVVCRGNPGPRNMYNPRQDSNVVLHLSVIK